MEEALDGESGLLVSHPSSAAELLCELGPSALLFLLLPLSLPVLLF